MSKGLGVQFSGRVLAQQIRVNVFNPQHRGEIEQTNTRREKHLWKVGNANKHVTYCYQQ